jgi:hypothetical protein
MGRAQPAPAARQRAGKTVRQKGRAKEQASRGAVIGPLRLWANRAAGDAISSRRARAAVEAGRRPAHLKF